MKWVNLYPKKKKKNHFGNASFAELGMKKKMNCVLFVQPKKLMRKWKFRFPHLKVVLMILKVMKINQKV
jgi:hypothetical protein